MGDVDPVVAVVGGAVLALLGRYAFVHAGDRRDTSGGAGSWMAPSTRRFWAAVLVAMGLTMAVIGALA